jgi:DNA-binding NarL/FixJ family response regulator
VHAAGPDSDYDILLVVPDTVLPPDRQTRGWAALLGVHLSTPQAVTRPPPGARHRAAAYVARRACERLAVSVAQHGSTETRPAVLRSRERWHRGAAPIIRCTNRVIAAREGRRMPRVLLVEDHSVVRQGVVRILSESLTDPVFGEAANASVALELLAREPWDLVLVDLNLPGRDGISLLEEIRALHPALPTLVVSAYPEEEFAVRCLRLGVGGYVTKASAAHELAAAVSKVLSGGKYVTAALAEKLAAGLGDDFTRASHEALSNRELQVLRLVAVGRSLKQIAAELELSEKTVGTYRSRIAEKLRISTNVELARYALRHNLVD